uniref:Phosphatidylinositol-specific phospholipase C X domain-containing protein n=1 Tax=Xiphophorus couchianus TaxID=32473 RepID=A0A3B5MNA5_9TELE
DRKEDYWMSSLPEELLDVPLWNLAIPGSHDSMSFCLDMSSPVLRSEPWLLRIMDRLFPCLTRPCIYRWSTTQVPGSDYTNQTYLLN